MKKVSIIVPIYNAEKYIERCAISLFEQDFEDIEYVFVNDCTPDNSLEVLQKLIDKYPNRRSSIKIIHNKENKGTGYTRKIGLENATGKYTIQIDSDDWCELNMISSLYVKAQETDADIVVCDVVLEHIDYQEYLKQQCSNTKEENISKLLSAELLPSFWNKLIKRDLYLKNNISPSSQISYSEDKDIIVKLFFVAHSVVYIPQPLYHYRKNNAFSLTKQAASRVWTDLRTYVNGIKVFLHEKGMWEKYKDDLWVDIVSEVIIYSQRRSENIYKNIRYIDATVNRWQCVKYLWRSPYWNYKTKLIYSLLLLNCKKTTAFVLAFKSFLKRVLKKTKTQ